MIQSLRWVLITSGIFLVGLAGLEKIILFSAVFNKTHAMDKDAILINIPKYFWNITNYTGYFGIIMLVAGIAIVVYSKVKDIKH
ncbi:hypothetical protein PC41400_16695 [Paenibacillus chitinolyticus]|uniref:Uncharacterized protein n=1 Tax=Paenibacillus chitinolyticus TaxID=79263 RepID=A0A410WY18_9BACL|nr:hypothetical protein [Paenibacillus chitinolyticus]MCY9589854.1 hypothetical protein [Paenibacillus chitinolyticus]MCY9598145.1 hypothetical protein [Paenibacillus chitinolyticus]QAV19230.1 hypothetical protein PC41400_16695 [Paenibacillus chitinolyticus]